MNFRSVGGGCEGDGDEVEMVNVWNIWHHGAGPVRQGIFSVDVFGEYILEYGTDCMLSGVQQQVVECACVMGPYRQRLSWSNFRSILTEILQVEFK